MSDKLVCIDLFCGLGGWAEGFLSEGYEVVGFDNGECGRNLLRAYPGELVIQDILTLHGRQFREATVIVASPPCQAYSYRAMPWKRAKALPPPDNTLFEACFRIQHEASEAAGRTIPLIVENVRGAQKWVGRAKWHYGSYYLWGDVPALMPITVKYKSTGMNWNNRDLKGQDFTRVAARQNGYGKSNPGTHDRTEGPGWPRFIKGFGGTWFGIQSNGDRYDQRMVNPCRGDHIKIPGNNGPRLWSERRVQRLGDAMKQPGLDGDWFDVGMAFYSPSSSSRKLASALIAKIPFPLASWIAKVFKSSEFDSESYPPAGRV